MTDRELIERAAKAADYTLGQHRDGYSLTKGGVEWNPLRDDGDALRLATKLHIDMTFGPDFVTTLVIHPETFTVHGATENSGSDMDAATRRAIVLAAAAISTD